MRPGFRQSMAWLHTWSGLVAGWLLFAVFLTGTASYLRPEITRWMRPEIVAGADPVAAGAAAVAELRRIAPDSPSYFLGLPSERDPITLAFWRGPAAEGRPIRQAALDPSSGALVQDRASRGGEFFYRFHFQLHYLPVLWGRWAVSVCAMLMLVAIVSGIVTHRRIFADFFTFRPGKGQRSWLDGHAVAAVLALPFHLMITYTGLVTLMTMILPWGIGVAYGPAGSAAFFAESAGGFTAPRAVGQPGTLAPIAPMLEHARAAWDGDPPARLNVLNPGDARSTVVAYRGGDDGLAVRTQGMAFAGTTGAVLAQWGTPSAVRRTQGTLVGLHVAHFAGPWLRGLFLVAGLAGTAMVGTGCVLWAVKRRRRDVAAGFGHRLVDVSNVAAVAGLPVAMAAFLWGNRLLPLRMPDRAEWEIHVFFIAWAACLVHAVLRPRRQAWAEQFATAAALCLLLPVASLVGTGRNLLRTLPAGDWGMAGFELGVAALGAGLLAIALACRPGRRRDAPGALPAGAAE